MGKLIFQDSSGKELFKKSIIQLDLYNKILKQDKSVLRILSDNDVPIPYGCMGGSCGACKCKVRKGKEFIQTESLGENIYQDIGEDEVLTCISTLKKDIPENSEIILQSELL